MSDERLIPINRLAPKQFERAVEHLLSTCQQAEFDVTRDMVVLALTRAFTKRWLTGRVAYQDVTRAARSFLDGVYRQTDALEEVVQRNMEKLGSGKNPVH